MLKKVIVILVSVCFGSAQAMAADTTWFCSALMDKKDTKPTAFKFVTKGGELIDMNLFENALWKRWEGQQAEQRTDRYKIVEDTDIGLVAIRSEMYVDEQNKKPTVYVSVISINKSSGEFAQRSMTTSELSMNYEGTCQVGK
jgi:hypothetical protein